MDDDSASPDGELVIPAGQDAVFQRMLSVNPKCAGGFKLVSIRVDASSLLARYVGSSVECALRLSHVQERRDGPHGFRVQLQAEASDPNPEQLALISQVSQQVTELQHNVRWKRLHTRKNDRTGDSLEGGHHDIEIYALRAGLKPCVRRTMLTAQVESTERRLRSEGLVVLRLERTLERGGTPWETLYIARREGDAERVRRAERRQHARWRLLQGSRNWNHELGLLLGYPKCCVEVFSRLRDSVDKLYAMALQGWVPVPEPRLNCALDGEGKTLLSYYPCRFDCSAALAQAKALCELLDDIDAESRAELDAQLAVPVGIHASGLRAELGLEGDRIVSARPLSRSGTTDTDEVPRLVGARLQARGGCEREGWVVLDFAARGRVQSAKTGAPP